MTEQSQHRLAEPLLAQLSGRFSQEELDRVRHRSRLPRPPQPWAWIAP